MLELLADLLPWLACFYLLDGLSEPRRGHWLLADAGAGRFRWLGPGHGLRLVGLSPLEEVVAAFDQPVLLAEEGILAPDPDRRTDPVLFEPSTLHPLSWDGLEPEVEGRKVRAGGRLLARAPHPALASALALALERGAAAPPGARVAAAGGRPDVAAEVAGIAAARRRQAPWRRALRVTSLLLFLGLFGLGGALAWAPASIALDPGRLLAALGLLLAVELTLSFGFVRASGAPPGKALAAAGGLLAWPVAALHPLAHLSRGAWAGREAWALAAALLPTDRFEALASRELGRLTESQRRAEGPLAEPLRRRRAIIEAAASAAGLSPPALAAPPRRLAGEAAWCPACRATYLAGPVRCVDCDLALLGFPAAPGTAGSGGGPPTGSRR